MLSDSNWCILPSKKDDVSPIETPADLASTHECKSKQYSAVQQEDQTPTRISMNRGPNYRNASNKLKGTLATCNPQKSRLFRRINKHYMSYHKSDHKRGRTSSDFGTMRQQTENWGSSSNSITDADETLEVKENRENQNILVGLAKKTMSFVISTIANMIGGKSDGDRITDDMMGRPRNIGSLEPHADLTTWEVVEQAGSVLGVTGNTSNRADIAIGIDLGTCYASAAACLGSHVDVIQNTDGKRKISCCVSFTNIGRLIGVAAEDQAENYIKSTIFNAKSLIGRHYSPDTLQIYHNKWAPLNITLSCCRPTFEVEYKGDKKHFLPEEISSMILVEIKEIAEAYLKSNVKDVVITVPANFTDSQRIATRDAGRIAGLNVLELISDTTAAAITYHSLQVWMEHIQVKNVLIVDLGGGTFDVSVIKVTGHSIEVKSVEGSTQFGGSDFDVNFMHEYVKYYERNLPRDILTDPKAVGKLRKAFEKAKKILYNLEEAHVNIPSFINGHDLPLKITRAKFEELNFGLLKWCMEAVEACVSNAKMKPNDIDDIILVGGSSRIPYLQQHLQAYFKKEHCKRINPDEAVVQGAAIRAAFLSTKNENPRGFPLITPIPPKIQNIRPYFNIRSYNFYQQESWLISRISLVINNPQEMVITTTVDNQYFIPIYVYGGEGPDMYAQFSIYCIPPRPRAVEIIISFVINNDGILGLSAHEKHDEQAHFIVKKEYFDGLNDELIEEKKKEVDMLRTEAEDKYKAKRDAAIESFELCIYSMKRKVKNTPFYSYVEDQVKSAYKWIESNPHAMEEQIMNQMEEFKRNCNYLMNRH